MKLIHSADIHLDSPMRGLARYDGAPVERVRLATRVALANLVDLTLEEGADVLLIAGDLFDGDWRDYGTGACFAREMGRLRDAGVRVVTVAGNHDAASRITKVLRMPDNVRSLSTTAPETVLYEDLGLAVHGQGFATRAVSDDLSASYPQPVPGYLNVGLLHTSANGRPGHEPYAPCVPEQLAQHGYDYWALGHVHRREVVVADPPVLFAGCLQGRFIREAGAKGATVLQAEADGTVSLEARALDDVRWALCEVDAAGVDHEDDVWARVAADVETLSADCDDRLLAVRVLVHGATAAHAALIRSAERLRQQVALVVDEAAASEVWVERVEARTSPPSSLSPEGDDAYTELVRSLRVAGDDGSVAALAEELEPLARKLPAAMRSQFDPSDPDTIRALLSEVERVLPTRLLEEPA